VIRDEMEQTRANLADKLGALENQVRETVSDATEAVSSTVEGVKDVVSSVSETVESVTETFNVSKHVEENPWIAFGAAVAAGFIAAQLFGRSSTPAPVPAAPPAPPPPQPRVEAQAQPAQAQPQQVQSEQPKQHSESLLGSLEAMLPDVKSMLPGMESLLPDGQDLKKVMDTAIGSFGGLAVGTMMGVVRELAVNGLPPEWKGELTKMVDKVTEQLGGKVLQPISGERHDPHASQPEQGRAEQTIERKKEEGIPWDPQKQQLTSQVGTFSGDQPAGNGGPRDKRGAVSQPTYKG